jgi:hypothetical protein
MMAIYSAAELLSRPEFPDEKNGAGGANDQAGI